MIIVLLGSPGVGKGTVSDKLIEFGFKHISTGNLVREEIKTGSEIGLKMKEFSSMGELVPTKYITDITNKALTKIKGNIILDGYPRNMEQAEAMTFKIDKVINLKTSENVIIERLSGRRVCPKCGQLYHIKNFPPKKNNLCDNDNETLIQRVDDKPEVIRERLRVYKDETLPLEAFYSKKGLLIDVDASGNPDDIAKSIINKIKG